MKDSDWRILYELHKTSNLTKTANLLFMTQPTLTKRLKQMETEWGCTIVDRTPKGLTFTAEGNFLATQAEKYLDLFDDVDAVYAGDLLAVACMAVAEKRGIQIPEELKIIGYDGLDIGKFVNPPLTTVKQNIPQMAKCCVDTIMHLLDGDTEIEMKQICDVELIKGGTI